MTDTTPEPGFPTDTHPADELDLDEIVSDFAFGRPCHIPTGIVGDATRVVFREHGPALVQTIRAYRARVDAIARIADGLEDHLPGDAWRLANAMKRLADGTATPAEITAELETDR